MNYYSANSSPKRSVNKARLNSLSGSSPASMKVPMAQPDQNVPLTMSQLNSGRVPEKPKYKEREELSQDMIRMIESEH